MIYLLLVLSSFFFSFLEVFISKIKRRYFKVFEKIYICVLFLLFVFNRGNSDYGNYCAIFNGNFIVKEKGYLFFTKTLANIGGNHNLVLLLLGMLLIYVFFYLYKNTYKISFIFLYSIYTFMYDINQIRNLFCILFVLIGLKFLQKNKDIFYLIFNILGISFQRIGYIYIIFYILKKLKLKNYLKMIGTLFFLGIFFIPVFKDIMIYLFPDKAFFYFSIKPRFGMIIYCFFIVMDIFILKILKYNKKIEKDEIILIKFILFPIIFLPYSILSIELMNRVWRNSLYLKWIYVFKSLKNRKKKDKFIVYFTLIFQQIIILGIEFLKNREYLINLTSQLNNVKFYF